MRPLPSGLHGHRFRSSVGESYYVEGGDSIDGPPLVFLHSGSTDGHIWHRMLRRMKGSHRVYALDWFGFGQSFKPRRDYDLALYTEQLGSFLAHKDLKNPILVGVSIGAAVALEYAQQHPDKVGGIVLVNLCGGRAMLRASLGLSFSSSRWRKLPSIATFFLTGQISPIAHRVVRRAFGQEPPPDLLYRHLRQLQRQSWHARSRWRLMSGLSSFDKFMPPFSSPKNLPPVWVIWGANNRVLDVSFSHRVAGSLPQCQPVLFPSGGHLLMHEQAARLERELRDALETLDRPIEQIRDPTSDS
ncbi:MAG: alpha/beta hydrolase [Polyangiaceae bacterium]|nr:alpha/beta hydrolase [Polyangiaceae bacterium]